MGLSSNALIHFTEEKDALKGILSKNFRLKYCKETIVWCTGVQTVLYVPMVSFCDIPLSQMKNHISSYGNYGIGLSKEWAIKNGLNPVLYLQTGSNISLSYRQFLSSAPKLLGPLRSSGKTDPARQYADMFRYIKNYEGHLERKGKKTPKYRFSDEREWRYVHNYLYSCEMLYTSKGFDVKEAELNVSELTLDFEPNDVRYIFIENDEEISEFIDHLRKAKGKTYTQDDIERLGTRILTTQQIKDDI